MTSHICLVTYCEDDESVLWETFKLLDFMSFIDIWSILNIGKIWMDTFAAMGSWPLIGQHRNEGRNWPMGMEEIQINTLNSGF